MKNSSQHRKYTTFMPPFLLLVFLLVLLTGCAAQDFRAPRNQRWANTKSSELREPRAGEQFYFNIPMNEDPIAQKVSIKIKVSGYVTSGWLRFELRNPTGQAVWDSGIIKSGDYAITTEYAVPTGATGTYTLGLVYGANTQAAYNLDWRAIRLRPIIFLAGAVLVMAGLVSIIYFACKKYLSSVPASAAMQK